MTSGDFEMALRTAWLVCALALLEPAATAQAPRNYPYREFEGVAEDFQYTRNWRSYYWREDCTLLAGDDAGKLHSIIGPEPPPRSGHRFGPPYTGLKFDWKSKPRVRIIGVQAIDRQPEEYYDVKLDPKATFTAFILRVQTKDAKGQCA